MTCLGVHWSNYGRAIWQFGDDLGRATFEPSYFILTNKCLLEKCGIDLISVGQQFVAYLIVYHSVWH